MRKRCHIEGWADSKDSIFFYGIRGFRFFLRGLQLYSMRPLENSMDYFVGVKQHWDEYDRQL